MSSTENLQTGDGWTHLNNLETLADLQVDGNLTVLGTISGEVELTQKQIVTAITTVGNGTLTAAGLVGGFINRSGPTAAYSDTTATAAQIIAALPGAVTGSTIVAVVKNATAFTQTTLAGTGVTLPSTVILPSYSEAAYLITITGATTVSFAHISTTAITSGANVTSPAIGALSTAGAGTITAALIFSGIIVRSGSQSNTAFTDTTDTAANIIAACANLVNKIGTAMIVKYQNTTNVPATITGGTGVTVSGITVVPANSAATYLLTYTAANTMTMVGIQLSPSLTTGTFTANGASAVTVSNAAVGPGSNIIITLKTVGGTVGAYPAIKTITAGTGFTVAATASDTSVYNYAIIG